MHFRLVTGNYEIVNSAIILKVQKMKTSTNGCNSLLSQ